jgi:hypothetical protein
VKFLLSFALALQGHPHTLVPSLLVLKNSLMPGFCLCQFCLSPFLKSSQSLSVVFGDFCQFGTVGVNKFVDFSLFEFLLAFQFGQQCFPDFCHFLLQLHSLFLFQGLFFGLVLGDYLLQLIGAVL